MIRIEPVSHGKAFRQFLHFPYDLYRGDPNFIAPLQVMLRKLLSRKQNPFLRHSEVSLFIAKDTDGRVLGRIAGIYNKAHLDKYHDSTGFFGLFDCVNNQEVAGMLLDSVATWLREKKLNIMTGPENISTNDSLGILTRGFELPPRFQMPYNAPYYAPLLERNGFIPALKLYSYLVGADTLPTDLMNKAAILEERLARNGIRIRPINMSALEKELPGIRNVYNTANEGSWGFLPLGNDEFLAMAEDLKRIALPGQVQIAENNEGIIGYVVSVPDYFEVFRKIPNGRIFPSGWLTLLNSRKRIKGIRIVILGVLPSYRSLGVDWCMYAKMAACNMNHGFFTGEACYVMEENTPMNRILERFGANKVKEYTVYSKKIAV